MKYMLIQMSNEIQVHSNEVHVDAKENGKENNYLLVELRLLHSICMGWPSPRSLTFFGEK